MMSCQGMADGYQDEKQFTFALETLPEVLLFIIWSECAQIVISKKFLLYSRVQ